MSQAVELAVDFNCKNSQTRKQYLQTITIKVKEIQKRYQVEQLVMVSTIHKENNIAVSIIVRKISELNSFIDYITDIYGGHIIPCIRSNGYFSEDIKIEQLSVLIEQYLNDLRVHPYIRQDLKLFEFLFYQKNQFKKQQTYEKMLNNASVLSKKYLNSIFTRKQLNSKIPILAQLESTYQEILRFQANFQQIKKISLLYFKQHEIFQDIFTSLGQMSCILSKGLNPNQEIVLKVKRRIYKVQKFIKQISQAYSRIQIMNQTARQLRANINKGLHQKTHVLNNTELNLQKWGKTLNTQFKQFLKESEKACKFIGKQIYQMKKTQIEFTYASSEFIMIPNNEKGSIQSLKLIPENQKQKISEKGQQPLKVSLQDIKSQQDTN